MGEFRRIKRELAYQGTIMKIYKDYVEVNGRQAVWISFIIMEEQLLFLLQKKVRF